MALKIQKKEVVEAHCERCGHTWQPAKMRSLNDLEHEPKWCPKCNSPYWNRPVTKTGTSKAQKEKNNKRRSNKK